MTMRAQLGGLVYNNLQSEFGAFEGLDNIFAPRNVHESAFDNDFTEKQLLSDIYLEDASFFKLDNISLGRSFAFAQKYQARVFLTGSNLLVISGYSNGDPEISISGVDNNPYPRSRTFLLGLNVNF